MRQDSPDTTTPASPPQPARGGLFVSILSKSGVQLVNLAGLTVLARLLVPEDFGVVAMVMAVVGLGHLFKDMGLGLAAVRAATLDQAQINSLFWISTALGALMALIIHGAAPAVAALYQDERLADVTRVVALSFLVGGVATLPLALMRRHLVFGRLAFINIAHALATQTIGIVLALQGFGYWALVWAAVLGTLVNALMALALSGIRIGLPWLAGELRPLLGFGGYAVVFGLFGFIALSAHTLMLGVYHDAAAVGLYHRAFMIMTLLTAQLSDPLGTVATPVLSRLQHDLPAYRTYYLQSLRLLLLFMAALCVLLYACADEVVLLLLGSGWAQSAEILRLLSIGLVPQALCISTGWLYFSTGDTRSLMWWGIGGWGTLVLLLVLAAPGGMIAMAQAYAAGMFLLCLPCLKLALRHSGLPLGDVLRAAGPAVTSALLGGVALGVAEPWLADGPALMRLVGRGVIFSAVYLALMACVFRQLRVLTLLLPSVRRTVAA